MDKKALALPFKDEWITVIENFIRSSVADAKANGVVVGLSGGLDSAVVAKLCARALGKNKVMTVILPDEINKGEDALKVANELGLEPKIVRISDIIGTIKDKFPNMERVVLGNVRARVRMVVLYYFANANNMLVAGTSNKSEIAVGYFTKYGDGASDILPIGDLYKTQVRILAEKIGIPDWVIRKKPSAELWVGQSDEDEIGITYDVLDKILYCFELGMSIDEVAKILGIDKSIVRKVYDMMVRSMHKRRRPHIAKVMLRTFGIDWREW